jgi:hypothetical protein
VGDGSEPDWLPAQPVVTNKAGIINSRYLKRIVIT